LSGFAPASEGIVKHNLSKVELRDAIAEIKDIYTPVLVNKKFFKCIEILNDCAAKKGSPYSLRAIKDDGLDCGQALETDVVDYIGMYKRVNDGLDVCVADFYDANEASIFFGMGLYWHK
jgi:hypothetical protein